MERASEGANFGNLNIRENDSIIMTSMNSKSILNFSLSNVIQCVVPSNNYNELEIQFQENDTRKDEDSLVQITFHFPKLQENEQDGESDEDREEEERETPAEVFHKSILETGAIQDIAGDILVEFPREDGNFVSPRARYNVQMMESHFRLRGAQYEYKIPYDGINALFLLPKPDNQRYAFVISLDKPIRQGQQKYQHLVWETHKLNTDVKVNLSEEYCRQKYDGQLSPEMSGPTMNMIAKIFKILTQNPVNINFEKLYINNTYF